MIILADATDEIKRDMHELHPSSIYEIGDDGYSKGQVLSLLQFDSDQLAFKELNLSNSVFVKGDYIKSLIQYTENSFMISGSY